MIYYIHGFNSDIKEDKIKLLSKLLYEEVKGLRYDSSAPFLENLELLQSQITKEGVFMGTSLGGFFAQVLGEQTQSQTILINPVLYPRITLEKFLGKNTNFVTHKTFTLTQEIVDSYDTGLKFNTQTLVVVSLGDQVLNSAQTIAQLNGKVELEVLEGGNHSFDQYHEIKDVLLTFLGSPVLT